MVLQRAPSTATVWGFAPEGTVVTTTFDGVHHRANASSEGVWRTSLPPTKAGGPYTLRFSEPTGTTTIELTDVLFGDVYACGGQSNMQFAVGANANASEYAREAASHPDVRLFTVGDGSPASLHGADAPLRDLRTIAQPWAQVRCRWCGSRDARSGDGRRRP